MQLMLCGAEPADSEIETTEYLVPRDLFGPIDPSDPLDVTSPRLPVFDDLAPTWIEPVRDEEDAA